MTAVIADIDLIGSYSTTYSNWLWAWENFHVKENFRKRMLRGREFGEKHEYPWLNTAKWGAETADAWEMAAVAAHVLDAKGVYRSPHEGSASFLLIREIRKV
ncbi:DUF6882 domain-containing protein [Undibacterium sp. JH2W]|uniref:DUF6882 domain-containing protein n=1 Tax=Undibacterium sp. JH2W TaxID=3413037 RepID=UPI003BF39ECC